MYFIFVMCLYTYIPLTFHPKGAADTSQILLQNTHALLKWPSYKSDTADVTGGKLIAIWSQSISGVRAVNPLVAFYPKSGK
jgi:hypothetical protein